jgi:hypothetical protein
MLKDHIFDRSFVWIADAALGRLLILKIRRQWE